MTDASKVPDSVLASDRRGDEAWASSIHAIPDADGYVSFGDVARTLLGQQCQYASRYVQDWDDESYPNLGKKLRITGNPANYHSLRIHADDVDKFVELYRQYRNQQLTGRR